MQNTDFRARWVLCWLLFVATALSFLDRQVLSVLAPTLMAEFRINNTTYSRVVFCFVLSYTVMFSVGGRLMDRWGTRLGMALAVGVWSAASAAHAVVAGAMGLAAVRFLLGFGEGGCFPGATRGAVEWFPPQQRGLAIGIATGGAAFGAVLSPPLTAWLAVRFGWRAAFLVTGALGASWVAAWIATFRLVPAIHGAPPRSHAPSLKSVLADSDVWKILVARFLFDKSSISSCSGFLSTFLARGTSPWNRLAATSGFRFSCSGSAKWAADVLRMLSCGGDGLDGGRAWLC